MPLRYLIEFPLEDQSDSVMVEVVTAESEPGEVPAARPGEVALKATQSFEQALEPLKHTVNALVSKLRGLHEAPHEIEVEFGLKMTAEAGAIVAAVGMEANYKVTLKWKRDTSGE